MFKFITNIFQKYQAKKEEERLARLQQLVSRFGACNAQRIVNGEIWLGATAEMLVESLGAPDDIAEQQTARKIKYTYKYHRIGKNRYRLRVKLEDNVVVGWEDKGERYD